MRAYILSAVLALTHLTPLTFTAPLTSDNLSTLAARIDASQNAPSQLSAESPSPDKSLSQSLSQSLTSRASAPVWWTDPAGSQTKILITFLSRYPGHYILKLITTSYIALQNQISAHGDSVIPHGIFEADYQGLNLWTRNANNHQQTFGVLKAALNALNHYMFTEQLGSATFLIFDGGIEVGIGAIGPHAMMVEETAGEAAGGSRR